MRSSFDWERFLSQHHIETSGKGHTRGNIGVKCPWCGESDRGFHLGISLAGKGYRCWRNSAHRGVSPIRLIIALIGCSYETAKQMVGDEDSAARPLYDFSDEIHLTFNSPTSAPRQQNGPLKLLPEFRPIADYGMCRTHILPYLQKRGYSIDDIDELSRRFDLHYATSGPFAYRVIIPVYMDGELVTWTSRTITNDDPLRYRSLSTDSSSAKHQHLPCAKLNIKDCVLDYDFLSESTGTLVACEGPFDAFRVSFFGASYDIYGTCFFGKTVSNRQMGLIDKIAHRFQRRFYLADEGVERDTLMAQAIPSYLDFEPLVLPHGVEDPAALSFRQFKQLFSC